MRQAIGAPMEGIENRACSAPAAHEIGAAD